MGRATQDFAPSDHLLAIAEEFVERVRNRETPTVEEYIERYPDSADEIRRYLPMLIPASSAPSVGDSVASVHPIPTEMLPVGVSRYHVQTLIGTGSMGAVYQARDLELDRIVGLKIPQLDHGQSVERFYREARAMATVNHRNICAVYDVGQFEPDDIDSDDLSGIVGRPYLTMGYIQGAELSLQMTEEAWDQVDAAKLVAKIANALHVIHQAGVVHRDVKPGNIIMDESGEPVITDFGLARRDLPEEVELTVDGQIIGSPAYMSPEQINGRPELGPQADVYSLGVMLYEMLCGQRPFRGSPLTLLRDICWKEAANPTSLREDLDSDLESICLRAIEKDLEKRYQSASALADDLNAYLDGRYVPPPAPRPKRQSFLWFALPLAAVLLGLIVWKPEFLSIAPPEPIEDNGGFELVEDFQPRMSRDEFRSELKDAFHQHFSHRSYISKAPNISERYRKAFENFGISPDSTSANALKLFMEQQPEEIRTDILVGLESWLLCMLRESEDVPVPWLRTQLEANHSHHSPLRTALLEMDAEKIRVLTKQFAIKHVDPRIGVLCSLYMRRQDPESAMWLANQVRESYPENVESQATIGLLHADLKQHRLACEAFQKAADLDPAPQLYTRLSLCRVAQNQPEKAIDAASKALDLNPNHVAATYALGRAHFRAGHIDEAIVELQRAVESDCMSLPQAHAFLGRAYVRSEDAEQAMKHARLAIEFYRGK